MGKLPKFPGTFLLGMCLLTHGYYVHCWLWRRLCKNHPGSPVHGLLHPRWFGKNPSHYLFLLNILHATNHHSPPGVTNAWDVLSTQDALHLLFTLRCFCGSPHHHSMLHVLYCMSCPQYCSIYSGIMLTFCSVIYSFSYEM